MTAITQKNLRTILPSKIALATMLIAEEKHCTPIEALLYFYKTDVYKDLETESTKRWWQSPLELVEDIQR